ncbi:unnamed protein product [Schistosoma mattheei]|uniref:Uncharacterized protein n=1 Tax=Schistosoma mattheei TaxID=31246 RepID=A0A183PNI7_9TREM|nr:unnamed protein product [Schistosoma mattheei]
MESSRPNEKMKTKEHTTSRNGGKHEKNEQQLDRSRKEGLGHSVLENAGTLRQKMETEMKKNEPKLDRTRMECRRQNGLQNAGRRPMLHCE